MATPPTPAPARAAGPVQASPPPAGEMLVAGRYAVDVGRPLPGAGGGLPAFAAVDRQQGRGNLMAVQVAPNAPPRAGAFAALAEFPDPNLLVPLAYGPAIGPEGRAAWFVICPAPPGPALWPAGEQSIRPWSEADLIGRLLRPVAAVLAGLEAAGTPHRALRPDNIFLDPDAGGMAVLGCAWAGPPGFAQPALFDPPYLAMCPPASRGEGRIADDIYALGVTMLALAQGKLPLAGLDDDAIIRRKLELGCAQALASPTRLPAMIADLVGGMLAQEPHHRPTPALLADPAAARARRVAARPPRRATRALDVGGLAVADARTLAFAIARQPEQGAKLIRIGVADHWLRRSLGDTALAARIEEVQRLRAVEGGSEDPIADARLVLIAVAMLDPLAPLCWRGLVLWPDALGTTLTADPADHATRSRIEEIISQEIAFSWGTARSEHCTPALLRQEAKIQRAWLRQRGWSGGLLRLEYSLNPLLPCRSPMLGGRPVARLEELLPALEAAAASAETRTSPPIDRELAAFIAARQDGRLDSEIAALGDAAGPERVALGQLAVLALLQGRLKSAPMPGLSGWLAEISAPSLDGWHNRETQAARRQTVAASIPGGNLGSLLGILEDVSARDADARGHAGAAAEVRQLDAKLAQLTGGGGERNETALRLGQETAAAIALVTLVVVVVLAAMG